MKHILPLLLAVAMSVTAVAQDRSCAINFNENWKFARFGLQPDGTQIDEPTALEAPEFDDSAWRQLDVPHDWGIEGPFRIELNGNTGKLPWSAIGWYRKSFDLPADVAGKQIYLDFDGAMAYAKIWCNGQYVGTWPYGYSSFRMDITPFVKPGQKNVVAVRLDTQSWDSRWYPGAGIYRNVWLQVKSPVHVGHWGTNIKVAGAKGEEEGTRDQGLGTREKDSNPQSPVPNPQSLNYELNLDLTVENHSDKPAQIEAKTEIFELQKNEVKSASPLATLNSQLATLSLPANGSATVTQTGTMENPKLWTLESPNLYVARTTLTQDGKVIDVYETPFGVRTIKWDRQGFYLNGERVQIKGVCQHHDLGALGAALNRRALTRQLEILKEMGVNAIRTSHNPPAPELLELTDKMGFIVLDEAFDCWERGKRDKDYNRLYKEWHQRDLEALVLRDRNHPSVAMWSIGNEVMEQTNRDIHRHLAGIVRALDTSRPISNGYNNPDGGRNSGSALELDVMGVNYFFGGQRRWDNDDRYKNFPHLGTETSSCLSTRGEYYFDDEPGTKGRRRGFMVDSYDQDRPGWGCTPDQQFRWLDVDFPYFWGEFVWTGFDYLGEPTPFNSDHTNLLNFRTDPVKWAQAEKEIKELEKTASPARSSFFGIVDLAGLKKDRFYLYQSQWRPELQFAHILPHWNWANRVGKKVPVHVYTSGDEAELFVNGVSQGVQKREKGQYRFVWNDVIYQPGNVTVKVTKNGKPWAESTVETTDNPAKLALEPDRTELDKTDKTDLSYVTVRVTDAKGRTVPTADNQIRFRIDGPGEVVAVDNGSPISFEPFQASTRKAFNGLAIVIVKRQKDDTSGKPFKVIAEADGLETATAEIR